VALQLLLGSDPLREASNLLRARGLTRMTGRAHRWARQGWNVLYGAEPWEEMRR